MNDQTLFAALADLTRRRILVMLLEHDERCVCDLVGVLEESRPKVSRHPGVLREGRPVLTRRDGVWMHYRLNREIPAWAFCVLWHMKHGMATLVPMPSRDRRTCEA
jgi:ArsR family transcriptional regulator, arsenate/arsenite/antimonite-responsive transcriptional repressor